MKRTTLLNCYLIAREHESTASKEKDRLRDEIVDALPPCRANEWTVPGWGNVTFHAPKDSLVIDVARLRAKFPAAYKACTRYEPNGQRLCVYPKKETIAHVFQKGAPNGRFQAAHKRDA